MLNLLADLWLEVDMITFINSRIRDFKTLVNPIMGLPTPHQKSVLNIRIQLAEIHRTRDFFFNSQQSATVINWDVKK